MNHMDKTLKQKANICAICHDQCVSACPIFESTRRMSAYPSRLAMLAIELDRGGINGENIIQLLTDCIGCGACLEGCIYLDHPNDISPIVRWARHDIQASGKRKNQLWYETIKKNGSPFEDTYNQLSILNGNLDNSEIGDPILVYLDAATLHYAPQMAISTLELLSKLGYKNIVLSKNPYLGGELREYGYQEDFNEIARHIALEVNQISPKAIITSHPLSAYLFREVYPVEAGIDLQIPVYTLAEALYQNVGKFCSLRNSNLFLLQSNAESFRMGGGKGKQFFEFLGSKVYGLRTDNLIYRDMSYPDGEITEIESDPYELVRNRIFKAFSLSKADQIVTTSPEAFYWMQKDYPKLKITDLATFSKKVNEQY